MGEDVCRPWWAMPALLAGEAARCLSGVSVLKPDSSGRSYLLIRRPPKHGTSSDIAEVDDIGGRSSVNPSQIKYKSRLVRIAVSLIRS